MPSTNKNTKKQYGKGWGGDEAFEDLECPSGTWCQVRKPNPQQLLTLGLIDNLDAFSGLVDKKHIKRVKGAKVPAGAVTAAAQKAMEDPKAIITMLAVADKVIEHMVVQPTVRRPIVVSGKDEQGDPIEEPLPYGDRDPEVVYTDQLDYVDKIWIFQYCAGGHGDLAQFREQIGELTPNVGDVDEVEDPAV